MWRYEIKIIIKFSFVSNSYLNTLEDTERQTNMDNGEKGRVEVSLER